MRVKVKVWLDADGQIMGEGLYQILRAVDNYGSINQAAATLKMSYRQAWGRIKKAEQRLGITLLSTHVGGESGGGARLTEEGRKLLEKYDDLQQEVQLAAEEAFLRHFGQDYQK